MEKVKAVPGGIDVEAVASVERDIGVLNGHRGHGQSDVDTWIKMEIISLISKV
jgi:hypothetical protein